MTLEELARLVRQMRHAQSRYFRDRSQQNLLESKDWERKVDQAVAAVLDEKGPGLFDEKIKEQP